MDFSKDLLKFAIIGIEQEMAELDREILERNARRDLLVKEKAKLEGKPLENAKRHTMSPEARERIAAAQRARWAKLKGRKGKK